MGNTQVIVGLGSCGIAAGANKVFDKIQAIKDTQTFVYCVILS